MNGKKGLIADAKGHMQNVIVPGLAPSIEGEFQVRLIGCDAQFAEIELRIVDPKNKDIVVHSFGSKTIEVTRTITLHGLTSKINFVPEKLL